MKRQELGSEWAGKELLERSGLMPWAEGWLEGGEGPRHDGEGCCLAGKAAEQWPWLPEGGVAEPLRGLFWWLSWSSVS